MVINLLYNDAFRNISFIMLGNFLADTCSPSSLHQGKVQAWLAVKLECSQGILGCSLIHPDPNEADTSDFISS